MAFQYCLSLFEECCTFIMTDGLITINFYFIMLTIKLGPFLFHYINKKTRTGEHISLLSVHLIVIFFFINTQVMMSTEHFMVTDIEWDPTGRYVASCVSWWGHKVSSSTCYLYSAYNAIHRVPFCIL